MRYYFVNLSVAAKNATLAAAIVALCATGKSANAATGAITAVSPEPGSVVSGGFLGVGGDVKLTTDDYGGVIHSTFAYKKDGALASTLVRTDTPFGEHEDKTFPVRMVGTFDKGKYSATYFATVDFFDGTTLSGSKPTTFTVGKVIFREEPTEPYYPGPGGLAGP